MAGAQDLHHRGPYAVIALLGASLVVLSVAGKPLGHAGFGLAGFLLWVLGAARLLGGQMLPRAPARAVEEPPKLFSFGRQEPELAPAPA